MAWTAPYDWSVGEVVTAAKLNEQLRHNMRYLKGLDEDVVIEDDINIGANKLKTTTLYIDEISPTVGGVRRISDNANMGWYISDLQFTSSLIAIVNALTIRAPNADNNYLALQARDNANTLVEIARLQGAADPYFRMTLPQVLLPGTAPGTLVEGHFWYLGADDKLYYRDASANIELVAINGPARGDILYRGAANWLNLAKGTAGYYLQQGADDPAWASGTENVYVASGNLTAGVQNAKIFSWQNTVVSGDILVFLVIVDITTGSTAAATIDVGEAATEVRSDNLMDGEALTNIASMNSIEGAGAASALGVRRVADDQWITGFEGNVDASTDLVGKYYILYALV